MFGIVLDGAYLGTAVAGVWVVSQRCYRMPSGLREMNAHELGVMQKTAYPGFEVGPGDFRINDRKELARVNDDGSVVPLWVGPEKAHKIYWRFNESSGEFLKRSKKRGGFVTVEAEPYTKRVTRYVHKKSFSISDSLLVAVVGGLGAAAVCWWVWNNDFNIITGIPLMGVFAALATFCFFYARNRLSPVMGKAFLVGPQPLKMKTRDYGPGVGVVDELAPETDEWKPYA